MFGLFPTIVQAITYRWISPHKKKEKEKKGVNIIVFFLDEKYHCSFQEKTHTKIICTKLKKIRIKKGPHTLSCSVMESCWLVGARIRAPVADLSPSFAKELWVVNHEYLLNGSVFTFSSIPHGYKPAIYMQEPKPKLKIKIKQIYHRNWTYGFYSGAFRHQISVCDAGLAVQPRVAVAVLDAFLSLLEIAEKTVYD